MGLLAYDGERLARLLARMRSAHDELRALTCVDPAAATAMHLVRTTAAALEFDWIPLVMRVVLADPLSRHDQTRAGIASLANAPAFVMSTRHGWSVQLDPFADDPLVVTLDETRAVAERLNAGAPAADDRAEMEWLAQQLAIIGRDPLLSREFLAGFHEWATLADRLAAQRLRVLMNGGSSGIDAVLRGLAGIARQRLSPTVCSTPSSVVPDIDDMHPYSAALLVQHLGLDGVTLAQVADHLLRRWVEMPYEPPMDGAPTDIHWPDLPNTGDILFTLLLADSLAGREFVRLAVDHPAVLFATADDPALAYGLVLAATDPATTNPAEAGAIVMPVLDYFAEGNYILVPGSDGYARDWPLFLVDLLSPWTMQFSPQNAQFTSDSDHKERLLAFAIRDAGAVERLLQNADQVQHGVLSSIDLDDLGVWIEFAAYLGMLARLISRQRVRDEEQAEEAFGMMLDVVGLATGFLPGNGLLVGAALVAAGELAPYDPARVAADANYAEDCLLTTAAAAVAATVHAQWSATGVVPPGFPPPPSPRGDVADPGAHFVADLRAWSATLPGQPDGRNLFAEMNGFTGQVMGAASAAAFAAG